MSFWSIIGGWFHRQANSLEKVFKKIEPLAQEAESVVAELSAVIGGVDQANHSAVLDKVSGFLNRAVPDIQVVGDFLKANDGVPAPNLFHNAAVLALKYTKSGALTNILRDLDLAVQLAHNVNSEKDPALSGGKTISAILVKPGS